MQGRTGLVAERQQDVVLDVLESAGTVRANDHAVEAVTHVHRGRHEGIDLLVGRRAGLDIIRRCVLAHDLVEGKHLVGEALCDGAVLWVVCEAVRDHHV